MSMSSEISAQEFKAVMRNVAASVAVITSGHGTLRNGLTATAVCSVCAEPPTILVCVNRNASAAPLITESGTFAVNFLADHHRDIAQAFATSKLDPAERFAKGHWTALATGAPVLDEAVAAFDCSVESTVETETHCIYFGRVRAAATATGEVLLYHDGAYRTLSDASAASL